MILRKKDVYKFLTCQPSGQQLELNIYPTAPQVLGTHTRAHIFQASLYLGSKEREREGRWNYSTKAVKTFSNPIDLNSWYTSLSVCGHLPRPYQKFQLYLEASEWSASKRNQTRPKKNKRKSAAKWKTTCSLVTHICPATSLALRILSYSKWPWPAFLKFKLAPLLKRNCTKKPRQEKKRNVKN